MMDQGIRDHEVHFRDWLKDLLKDNPKMRDNYVMAYARDDALAQVVEKLLAQLKEYEQGQGPKIRILENQVERLTAELAELKERTRWHKYPDELPVGFERIIATDGMFVQSTYFESCNKNALKYWQYLPEPPEEELTAWEKIKPDLVGIIKKRGGNNAR